MCKRPRRAALAIVITGAVALLAACVPGNRPPVSSTQPGSGSTPGAPPLVTPPAASPPPVAPPEPSPVDPVTGRFVIGAGQLTTVWVDPATGSDSATGTSPGAALRTFAEAWRRIPASQALATGFRILLQPGQYPAALLPSYMEHRWGTPSAPIIVEAAAGRGTVRLTGDLNVFDTQHLYLLGLVIERNGDAFHCERCSNILIRDSVLGGGGGAHEVIKANQSDHIFIEDSDIGGAWDNAIDFVAVAGGHLIGNDIHDADDWCAYAKGGSSGIRVD